MLEMGGIISWIHTLFVSHVNLVGFSLYVVILGEFAALHENLQGTVQWTKHSDCSKAKCNFKTIWP